MKTQPKPILNVPSGDLEHVRIISENLHFSRNVSGQDFMNDCLHVGDQEAALTGSRYSNDNINTQTKNKGTNKQ
jgi:hypothetical protein